ncbi:hypothetical protein [Falsiroseomonas sp. HW251]|uniref:hypothetical protein n=1 Tax=Falsiroseomonas sp. HW251 TaxID=3390998 RepID=UPI003D31740C
MKRLLLPVLLLLPAACAEVHSDAAQLLEEVMQANQASAEAAPPPAATPPAALPVSQPPGGLAARRTGSGEVALASQLVGATPEILMQLLGQPRLRREEGSAEIWHYQAPQCHLDVILYPAEGARSGLRVGYAAARAEGAARRAEAACLRDIARGAAPVIGPDRVPAIGVGMGA